MRFLLNAIRRHGVPETITIDGSEANAAASRRYNAEHGTAPNALIIEILGHILASYQTG